MFLVECYNDETVLRVLGVPKAEIRRMRGKGNVLNRLKREAADPITGMVDRDSASPHAGKLVPFVLAEECDGLALHTWKKNRLVVVDDRIEDWIMNALKQANMDPAAHRLPTNAAGLHRLETQVMDTRLVDALTMACDALPATVRTMRRFLGLPVRQ